MHTIRCRDKAGVFGPEAGAWITLDVQPFESREHAEHWLAIYRASHPGQEFEIA